MSSGTCPRSSRRSRSFADAATLRDDSGAPGLLEAGRRLDREPDAGFSKNAGASCQRCLTFQMAGIPGHPRSRCSTAAGHLPPERRSSLLWHPACLAFLEEHSDFPKRNEKNHIRGSSPSLLTFLSYLPEFRGTLVACCRLRTCASPSTTALFGGRSWSHASEMLHLASYY